MRNSTPLITLLACLGLSTSNWADDSTPKLPVYETEEILAPKLDEGIVKSSEKIGVTIKKRMPLPPEPGGKKTIAIGIALRAEGKMKELTKYISEIGSSEKFRSIPSLSLVVNRKDPTLVHADLIVKAWYAVDEKSARKTKKWRASLSPKMPAMEIFTLATADLAKNKITFTSFSVEGDSIRISGEAPKSSSANQFGAELFKNDKLSGYELEWEMRPKINQKKKDGSVEFSISGKQKLAAKKKKQKKQPATSKQAK